MGEKLSKFKNLVWSIFRSATKHKVIFADTIIAAVFGIIVIYMDSQNNFYDMGLKIFKAFMTATVFAVPATYVSERFSALKKYLIQAGASLIGAAITYCILKFVEHDSYSTMYLLGINFAVICVAITLLVPKENAKSYYANLIKNFLFCDLLSLVGMLGTALLTVVFSNLIIEIDDMDNLIFSQGTIWGLVVSINLFVFYLFEKREEPSGKAFKIIFLFILFPIYLFLLLILYAYLLKALLTLSIPNGQINWFVSFASVFYIVFYFIFREYEDNKFIKAFYRFGSLALIPLICVQWPAYFIRLGSYGFTGWRYSSLVYNIFTVIFIIFTFVKKGRYTKYAIPVLGAFILLTSVTPVNLIDVAYRSQYKRLTSVLKKYDMMENGQLKTALPDIEDIITDDDRAQLVSADRYLRHTSDHKKPDWLNKKYYDVNVKELYNIKEEKTDDDVISYEMKDVDSNERIIDIKGYSTIKNMYVISEYYKTDVYEEPYNKPLIPETQIDITEYMLNLKPEDTYFVYQIDENTKAYIYNVEYRYSTNMKRFKNYRFNCYLISK